MEWSQVSDPMRYERMKALVDDGSAANEPPEGIGIAEAKVRLGIAAWTKIYNEGGFDQQQALNNQSSAGYARSGVLIPTRHYSNALEGPATWPYDMHSQFVTVARNEHNEQLGRLAAQAEQIGALMCERDQLRREIATVRALLSRLPEDDCPAVNPVQADIERTIDHLLNGRTTKDQRKGLSTATERAERVKPDADAAVGRAIG